MQHAQFPVQAVLPFFLPRTREITAAAITAATPVTARMVVRLASINESITASPFGYLTLTFFVSVVASLYFLKNSI